MLERKQTIDGQEYAYEYGGNGTIRITAPVQAVIDLKHMPDISVQHEGEISPEQVAHLETSLQAIVSDMFAQMPRR